MRTIRYHQFGEAEVLKLENCPIPTLLPHQVLVQVKAAGLNPIDYKTRRGLGFVASRIGDQLPWTPGYDLAGVVEAVADGVTDFKLGDRVCGLAGFALQGGAYAEYAAVDASALTLIPQPLSFTTAAAIPLAGLTAWQGLFEVGDLHAGQRILIHAGAGGVGHFAVQFARQRGAYVMATASARNQDFLESIGVDEFIDYARDDLAQRCQDLDFVLDTLGGDVGLASIALLKPRGSLVTVPTVTAETIQQAADAQGRRGLRYTVHNDLTQLEQILQLVADGQVQVTLEGIYPLERAAEAHRMLERGHVRGKLVLSTEHPDAA